MGQTASECHEAIAGNDPLVDGGDPLAAFDDAEAFGESMGSPKMTIGQRKILRGGQRHSPRVFGHLAENPLDAMMVYRDDGNLRLRVCDGEGGTVLITERSSLRFP